MTAAILTRHQTAVQQAARLGRGRHQAWCTCGWVGPLRRWRVGAQDDTAAHVLEVLS